MLLVMPACKELKHEPFEIDIVESLGLKHSHRDTCGGI
jgi:hypothetical protein